MNFDLVYISPVSGALIGYFTNWLAIRMLFRPHGEARLFGVKLPFTPGLIPKERKRLAASFGRAIEEHLLTPDALIKRLTSSEVLDGVGSALDGFVAGLKTDGRTLSEIAESLLYEDADELKERAARFLTGRLGSLIPVGDLFKRFGLSAEKKSLRELLPGETVVTLKNAVAGLLPRAAEIIYNLLNGSPENDTKLRELTRRLIAENVGGIVGLFVNKDRAYENIRDGALRYLSSPESVAALTIELWARTDRLLDAPLCELAAGLPPEVANELRRLETLGTDAFDRMLPAAVTRAVEAVFGIKIASVAGRIAAGYGSKRPDILNFIGSVIKRGASFAAGRLQLGKIAEEQMNGMDVRQVEEIVVSVCGRELKAITLLGGILGFIIGFTPIIFKMIGG